MKKEKKKKCSEPSSLGLSTFMSFIIINIIIIIVKSSLSFLLVCVHYGMICLNFQIHVFK